ncbi:c-type cytochrome [Flavobacterium sp.]|uniref:c-type cytochrome n=1 Tax=Flavobacterium sp. TaxID=239 RepID=UPI002FDB5735
MKKVAFLLAITFFISCKKESQEDFGKTKEKPTTKVSGKEIFEGAGNCIACHQPSQKIIGPSLQEIAKIYKTKNGNIVAFLKEESDPLVDPSQYDIMKTNFAITKMMTDEELQALQDYIYSFSK